MFSHNLFDSAYALLTYGLAATAQANVVTEEMPTSSSELEFLESSAHDHRA